MERQPLPEVRSNCALDLLRLICAVGVVTVHSIASTASAFSALVNAALHVQRRWSSFSSRDTSGATRAASGRRSAPAGTCCTR